MAVANQSSFWNKYGLPKGAYLSVEVATKFSALRLDDEYHVSRKMCFGGCFQASCASPKVARKDLLQILQEKSTSVLPHAGPWVLMSSLQQQKSQKKQKKTERESSIFKEFIFLSFFFLLPPQTWPFHVHPRLCCWWQTNLPCMCPPLRKGDFRQGIGGGHPPSVTVCVLISSQVRPPPSPLPPWCPMLCCALGAAPWSLILNAPSDDISEVKSWEVQCYSA